MKFRCLENELGSELNQDPTYVNIDVMAATPWIEGQEKAVFRTDNDKVIIVPNISISEPSKALADFYAHKISTGLLPGNLLPVDHVICFPFNPSDYSALLKKAGLHYAFVADWVNLGNHAVYVERYYGWLRGRLGCVRDEDSWDPAFREEPVKKHHQRYERNQERISKMVNRAKRLGIELDSHDANVAFIDDAILFVEMVTRNRFDGQKARKHIMSLQPEQRRYLTKLLEIYDSFGYSEDMPHLFEPKNRALFVEPQYQRYCQRDLPKSVIVRTN